MGVYRYIYPQKSVQVNFYGAYKWRQNGYWTWALKFYASPIIFYTPPRQKKQISGYAPGFTLNLDYDNV